MPKSTAEPRSSAARARAKGKGGDQKSASGEERDKGGTFRRPRARSWRRDEGSCKESTSLTHPPTSQPALPTHRPSPRAPAAPAVWWSSKSAQPTASRSAGALLQAQGGQRGCWGWLRATSAANLAVEPPVLPPGARSRPALLVVEVQGKQLRSPRSRRARLQGKSLRSEPQIWLKNKKIQSTGSKREGFSRWGMALGTFRSPGSRDRGQQPRSRPPLTPRSLSFGNARLAYR